MPFNSGDYMGKRLAFICLLPDPGHITPLLRLAASFAEHGYDIKCFCPEECIQLVGEFDIPAVSFGRITTASHREIFNKLAKHSIFYNAFTFYKDIQLKYYRHIKTSIFKKMGNIRTLLEQYDPVLIIADDHALQFCYRHLSVVLNKKVVFHASGGNYRYPNVYDKINKSVKFRINGKCFRYNFDRFTFNYGFTSTMPAIQFMIVRWGEMVNWFYYRLFDKKLKLFERNLIDRYLPVSPPIKTDFTSISTGLPFIEQEITKQYFNGLPDLHLFPPIKDKRKSEISRSLQQWIDSTDKNIVYVSFGTMVECNKQFVNKIIYGLRDLDCSILWVMPYHPTHSIEEFNMLPNIRIEKHAPQPRILALEKVRCFITHGGAGGIQDGLLNGKPMLCIPFMFDQPFNSSIVELLQVGIKLWKNKVSEKSIHYTVRQLLYDLKYWNIAQAYKQKLQKSEGGTQIIRFLKGNQLLAA